LGLWTGAAAKIFRAPWLVASDPLFASLNNSLNTIHATCQRERCVSVLRGRGRARPRPKVDIYTFENLLNYIRQVLPGGVGNTTMVVRAGDLRGIVLACAVLFMAGCSLLAYHEGIAAISGEPSQFSYLERWIAQRSAAHPEISRLGRCTSTSRTFEPQAKYP
jgi:hypothetical protein